MYLRAAHVEQNIPALRKLIKENPLGILTTAIKSPLYPLLQSSHVPWLLDVQDDTSETELGILRGHMARANPQTKAMIEHLTGSDADGTETPNQLQDEVMVLFNGPAHHYVTPKFYTTTKPATGKVVPTWNYAAVQAYGRATVYFDSKSEESIAYLSQQIRDLSTYAETSIMDYVGGERPSAWGVEDAPENYIEMMMKAIVGIKIEVTSLGGKFKMSQELGEDDRSGVIEGFSNLQNDTGRYIAETVEERGRIKAAAAAAAAAVK